MMPVFAAYPELKTRDDSVPLNCAILSSRSLCRTTPAAEKSGRAGAKPVHVQCTL